MQKRQNRGTTPLSFGQTEFREIKVEPVDGLVAELEKINAKAVAQLNAKQEPEMRMPDCRCPCEYCRRGRCDLHEAALRLGRDPYDEYSRRMYNSQSKLRWLE